MLSRQVTLLLSFPVADFLLDRIKTESALLSEPQIGPPPLHFTCATHPCCRMATDELSAISKQLHSQAQVTNTTVTLLLHSCGLEKRLVSATGHLWIFLARDCMYLGGFKVNQVRNKNKFGKRSYKQLH